jgi:hypothetical protein
MAQISVLAHLPRLRMEPDQVATPFGTLVKLTWGSYNSLTMGAFEDWQRHYEAADPVFVLAEMDVDLPFLKRGAVRGTQVAEMKFLRREWYRLIPGLLQTDFLTLLHEQLVDPVWGGFALAVPGAAPGAPRMSVTFLLAGDGYCVELPGHRLTGIRIQGEADQEYVFSVDTASLPVSNAQVVRALELMPVARSAGEHELLGPALRQLLATTEPTLEPGDRLMLSVSALEALLLPEVRVGMQDVFARRVRNLLGEAAEPLARDLYRARSRAVHDGPDAPKVLEAPVGLAEQLLADVIVAATESISAGETFQPDRLDAGPSMATTPVDVTVRGHAPVDRLLPRPAWFTATYTAGVDLSPPEGHSVSWSPLLGLEYAGGPMRLPGIGATLITLTPSEIVSMEEKDIRRDFIRKFVTTDVSVAGIAVGVRTDDVLIVDDALMARLLPPRDAAVTGLRLAGLRSFVDPELLGWYVYQGSLRYRRETVLRQTAVMRIGSEQTELSQEILEQVVPLWSLLSAYEAEGPSRALDRLLAMFRRAHDQFALPEARAALLFAVLEALLGRFRGPNAAVQLEELVGRLGHLSNEASAWFTHAGRRFRNATAHGVWRQTATTRDEESESTELVFLHEIVAAALRQLIELRTAVAPVDKDRASLLVDHLVGASR